MFIIMLYNRVIAESICLKLLIACKKYRVIWLSTKLKDIELLVISFEIEIILVLHGYYFLQFNFLFLE